MLFTNSRVVDVMLPIMAKLDDIKTLRAGTHSPLTGKSLRLKQLLLLKIICFFAITQFLSRTSKFWQVVTQNCTLRSKKVLLARDKSELNRNEKSASLLILMYSSSNTLFLQGLNVTTIVLLFHCIWLHNVYRVVRETRHQ